MSKEQNFLEKNIYKIQEYKIDGYDDNEIRELKFGKQLTKIFFGIEKRLKIKEHKNLFKEWFLQELNTLYSDGLSFYDYKNLIDILIGIKNNINGNINFGDEINKLIKKRIVRDLFNLKQTINTATKETDILISNEELTKLSVEERLNVIEQYIDTSDFEYFIRILINNLYNLKNLDNNITENIMDIDEDIGINNIKVLILTIVRIESDGNPIVKNKTGSSALGLGQWLVGNGRWSYEYLYKKRFYREKDIKKITNNYKFLKRRNVWQTSSWETTLNNILKHYNGLVEGFLDWFPNSKIRKEFRKKPNNINWKEQLIILVLSLFGKNDDKLISLLLGDKKKLKEFYRIYHTNPDKKTIKRMNKIIPMYTQYLLKLDLE